MKNYKIIGLTGQSGAGKSTVSDFFLRYGAAVINADLLVKELYAENSVCLRLIAGEFGAKLINSDGALNRRELAKIAFSSPENTKKLNALVHPFVLSAFLAQCKSAAKGGAKLIVFDAPQLFECCADVFCDAVISVTAKRKTRLERICARDKITPDEAARRMNAQYDEEFFTENSDYVIDNSGSLENTQSQLTEVLHQITPN